MATAKTKKKPVKKAFKKVSKLKASPSSRIANHKSKIAPYKPKKNEKYMSAAMKKHFIAVLLLWNVANLAIQPIKSCGLLLVDEILFFWHLLYL